MTSKTKKNQMYLSYKEEKKEKALCQITDYLKDHFASYVLITCTEPTSAGQMQAELSYNGDEVLVSYLVDHAIQILDEKKELCVMTK